MGVFLSLFVFYSPQKDYYNTLAVIRCVFLQTGNFLYLVFFGTMAPLTVHDSDRQSQQSGMKGGLESVNKADGSTEQISS